MKKMKRVLIAIAIIFLVVLVFGLTTKDERLPGTYMPDPDATSAVWKPMPDVSRDDMKNILGQLFGSSPILFTDRNMVMQSGAVLKTNRYWVLWRESNQALIFHRPFSFASLTYEEDGIWLAPLPRKETSPNVKLKRMMIQP